MKKEKEEKKKSPQRQPSGVTYRTGGQAMMTSASWNELAGSALPTRPSHDKCHRTVLQENGRMSF